MLDHTSVKRSHTFLFSARIKTTQELKQNIKLDLKQSSFIDHTSKQLKVLTFKN